MTDDRVERFLRAVFIDPPSRFDWAIFILLLALLNGCATTSYAEAESCPVSMDEQQQHSGVVRCTALCSSWGRDFEAFGDDCKCYCRGPVGSSYRPQKKHNLPPTNQL